MSDSITINLNVFERKFLLFISYSRNEVDMNHNRLTDDVINALDTLEKKGAITKIKIIGPSNSFQYKLTSIGSNLVDLIKVREN